MKLGFLVTAKGNTSVFRSFGAVDQGRRPLLSFCGSADLSAVLLGRLHEGRTEWQKNAREKAAGQARPNEAERALAHYRRLGMGGIERLEGDFALVIHDRLKQRLIGVRDPLGGYPLFWVGGANTVSFSNSLAPLLALLPGRSLNLEYVAEYLTAPAPFTELADERCVYRNIHRVLPGAAAVAMLPAGSVRQTVYWHWHEHIAEPGYDEPERMALEYARCFRAAVKKRIQGVTGAHLSGGMDSAAVALTAADLISAVSCRQPLHTISLVYEKLPELARETPYLAAVSQRGRCSFQHRIPADGFLDFDGFSDPPFHEEPYPGLWRLALDRATVDHGAAHGLDTILTGLGADEMLDLQPYHITDYLKQGRWHRAWREAVGWALEDNCSPWEIMGRYGLANLDWTAWLRSLHRQRERGSLVDQDRSAVAAWILPGFVRRHHLRERAAAKARGMFNGFKGSTILSMALSSIASRAADFNRWYLAAPQGVAIAHPFLDVQLLGLSLGIAAKVKPVPGRMKPILAAAMRSTLPEKVRMRRRKGHFNEVYYLGLSKNLERLEKLIKKSGLSDLRLFDQGELIRTLRRAALGGVGVRACQHLNFTLSLIKWWSMQNDSHGREPTPIAAIRLPREAGVSSFFPRES